VLWWALAGLAVIIISSYFLFRLVLQDYGSFPNRSLRSFREFRILLDLASLFLVTASYLIDLFTYVPNTWTPPPLAIWIVGAVAIWLLFDMLLQFHQIRKESHSQTLMQE
jgi:phosphatidylglycerophosphate synthase